MAMQRAYGVGGGPFVDVFPAPFVTNTNPTSGNIFDIGQIWINTLLNETYVLTSIHLGEATWTLSSNNGDGVFDSLEVIPGRVFINSTVGVEIDVLGGAGISLDADTTSNFSVDGIGSNLNFVSSGGQVRIESGLDDEDAIMIVSSSTGMDSTISIINEAGSTNDAIIIQSLVGGVTLNAATELVFEATESSSFAVADSGSLFLQTTGSGNVFLETTGGGDVNISSTSTDAEAINIDSLGGMTVDAAKRIDITASDSSSFAVVGTGKNLTLSSASSSTALISSGNVAGAIQVIAQTGAANSLLIENTNSTLSNSVDINALAGGVTIDSLKAISLDSSSSSNFSLTGIASDLTLSSVDGAVIITSQDNGSSILLFSSTSTDSSISLTNSSSTRDAAIDIDALAGGMTVNTAKGIALLANDSSTFAVVGASKNLILSSANSSASLVSAGNIAGATQVIAQTGTSNTLLIQNNDSTLANAVDINALAGGVTIDSSTSTIALGTATAAVGTGLLLTQGTQTAGIYVGTGDPTLAAVPGSLYIKTDATTAVSRLWIRTDAPAWAFLTASS